MAAPVPTVPLTALLAALVLPAAASSDSLAGDGALWRWRPGHGAHGKSPLEILNRRFAAGEIDADDHRRRRQALGGPA